MNMNFRRRKLSGSQIRRKCTGVRSGFTTQLNNNAPQCIALHCIVHRLALASAQAADNMPYLL